MYSYEYEYEYECTMLLVQYRYVATPIGNQPRPGPPAHIISMEVQLWLCMNSSLQSRMKSLWLSKIPFQKKGVRAQRITFFGRVYGEKHVCKCVIVLVRFRYVATPITRQLRAQRPAAP